MTEEIKEQYHKLSEQYLEEQSLAYRKKLGQYFTPKTIREKLLSNLPSFEHPRILDPACGSGEFLLSAQKFYPNADLVGWDIDDNLVNLARQIVPTASFEQVNSIEKRPKAEFDIVVGNPPYFEFLPDNEIRSRFEEIIWGRTNIFSLFVKLGLDALKPGGYLAYVIPPSLNNGAYFKKLRDYITKNCSIELLDILNSPKIFHSAQQQVMIMILKKGGKSDKYQYSKNGIKIFTANLDKIKNLTKGKSTLFEKNFTVKTGQVVWNINKEKLSHSAENCTLLIWSHNIGRGHIKFKKKIKPQYITNCKKIHTGPVIVVNRITGATETSRIKAALIPESMIFTAENHVNMIFPPPGFLKQENALDILESIVRQLNSEETAQAIRLLTGNTQISKNELWKMLPLSFG